MRLELQSEQGDTQIFYDGHTVSMYDASSNTLYRYTVPAHEGGSSDGSSGRWRLERHPRSSERREDRRSDRASTARERLRRDADRYRGPGRLHGAGHPQGNRQPDRRRRVLLGCRPRRPAARRDLLHDERRAGDRTGGHRNLLRPGGRLGVRIHAAGEREGAGSRPPAQAHAPALRLHPHTPARAPTSPPTATDPRRSP